MNETPRGFENPYQAFVWKELSIIRELERQGNYYQALQFSVSLLKYLHPDIRKRQEEQARAILKKVTQVVNQARTSSYYTSLILKNRLAKSLGRECLEKVITALNDQLGARLYMERGAAATPKRPSKERMKVPDY